MNDKFKLLVSLALFGLLLSCSEAPKESVVSPKKDKKISSKKRVDSISQVELEKIFHEFLGNKLTLSLHEEAVRVTLNEGVSLSDEELMQKMLALSVKVIEKMPTLSKVTLETDGAQKERRITSFSLSDTKQFLNGDISKPELLRRLQVKTIETSDSLKLKLKDLTEDQLNEKLKLVDQLVGLEPHNEKVLAYKANILRDLNRCVDALSIYQSLSENANFTFFSQWNIAFCLEKMGDLEGSSQAYLKALEIDPNQPQLMRQLSMVYLKNSKLAEAEQWLDSSKTFETTDMTFWIQALLLREKKKYAEAQSILNNLHFDGEFGAAILYDKLLLDLDMRDFKSAKDKLIQLIQMAPALVKDIQSLEVFSQ